METYQVSQIPPLPWSKIFHQNFTCGVICDKGGCKIYAWGVIKLNFIGMKLLLREVGELFQINSDRKNTNIWSLGSYKKILLIGRYL